MKSERARRERGRGVMSVAAVAVVLAAVVVGVGIASYVTLSALGDAHSSSSTVHHCYPPGAPTCSGSGNATTSHLPAALGSIASVDGRA